MSQPFGAGQTMGSALSCPVEARDDGRYVSDGDSDLVKELAGDTAIHAADTLLLTVPNQLGVEYNAHAIESILRFVAPELGWR